MMSARKAATLRWMPRLIGNEGKEALDLVEPRGVEGGEQRDDAMLGSIAAITMTGCAQFAPQQSALSTPIAARSTGHARADVLSDPSR
jgi:hypothetical protein